MALLEDKDTVRDGFAKIIGNFGDDYMRSSSLKSAPNITRSMVEKCWNDFERAFEPAQKEAVLKDHACKIFRNLYGSMVSNMGFINSTPAEKLAMAQKLTDHVMNNYSPAASNSKYAEFGDNYYLKNTNVETVMKDTLYTDDKSMLDETQKVVDQAKLDLGIGKMHVDMSKDFREGSTKTTDKIKETGAPVVKNTKEF